jgi:glycosyltransferase involved in cell wall biosynthesis
MRLLGRVPYADVVGLMRASTAVLNPSLFEGWSTTVEEAKSLGKRVLLSDIPVHREQDPPGGLYFDPHAPEALAGAIEQALAERDRETDARREEAARAALPARRREFALRYERIVRETLAAR